MGRFGFLGLGFGELVGDGCEVGGRGAYAAWFVVGGRCGATRSASTPKARPKVERTPAVAGRQAIFGCVVVLWPDNSAPWRRDDARVVVAGASVGGGVARGVSRSVEQGAGPATKSVRLEAPRLARVARWWVAGSGRNLSAGPVPNIVRPFGGVRAVKTSSRSPTTYGFLRSSWSYERVYAECPFLARSRGAHGAFSRGSGERSCCTRSARSSTQIASRRRAR